MTSSLLLNNFYRAISTSPKEKGSDDLLCTVRSLVMVREPVAQRKGLNSLLANEISRDVTFCWRTTVDGG